MSYDERVDNKESERNMITLTQKEQDMVKSLIRLGDTEKEAIETVIENRNRPDNSEEYRFAYCN